MTSKQNGFPIERNLVARYFAWVERLLLLPLTVPLIALISLNADVLVLIYVSLVVLCIVKFIPWLSKQQSQALQYWLDGFTLRVDQGVFFLERKAIPLDRVIDVVLIQGPLMRACGIWGLQIQTASTGTAEATLFGLKEAEVVRDLLLVECNKAKTSRTEWA